MSCFPFLLKLFCFLLALGFVDVSDFHVLSCPVLPRAAPLSSRQNMRARLTKTSVISKQSRPQTRHRARRQRLKERDVGLRVEEMVSPTSATQQVNPKPNQYSRLTNETHFLRNSGLVDFEMWDPYTGNPDQGDISRDLTAEDSLAELRKWGLAHKPPAKNWWAEFGIVTC